MTIAPGILSLPLLGLRSLIAGSAAWQEYAGVPGDVIAAATLVSLLESPRNPLGKYWVLDIGDLARDRQSINSQRAFAHRDGSTLMAYMHAPAENSNDETAMLLFANAFGQTWTDVELAAGQYDIRSLAVKSIELALAPRRIVHEQRARVGDYFEAMFAVTYSRQP